MSSRARYCGISSTLRGARGKVIAEAHGMVTVSLAGGSTIVVSRAEDWYREGALSI